MADHGHHDPGGHELEAINTKLLFRLLISLSLVTLLAAAAVVQWFNSQRRELENRYAAEGSFLLADYKAKMDADLAGIDKVAGDMVAKPELLKAPPAPSGWIHPDDLVGGGAATPAAAVPAKDAPAEPAEPSDGAEAENGADADAAAAPEGDADKPAEGEAADADADKGNNGKAAEKQAENADKQAAKKAEQADKKADKADDEG